jgi:lysophospholipid acyltransferase (LPLAT)-like uncharacterized protein
MAVVGTQQRRSGVVQPHTLKWHQRLLATLVAALIRAVAFTLRKSFEDRTGLLDSPDSPPVIFVLWHNRLALAMPIFARYVRSRQPSRGLAAVVETVLEHFGAHAVRGSSSRRGPQALLEITRQARNGEHVAVTPDGPRGPCYEVQDGVIALAQLTGFALVPAGSNVDWKIRLGSWDRFQIPLPFARWNVVFAEPLRIPRDASPETREKIRQQLEAVLRSLGQD